MKNRIKIIVTLALIMLITGSCGTVINRDISENNLPDYKSLYRDFLHENYPQICEDNYNENFGLAFITDDDIPELFLTGTFGYTGVRVYTIEKNAVKFLGDLADTSSNGFMYAEKGNIFVASSGCGGGYFAFIYKYNGDKFEKIFDAGARVLTDNEAISATYGFEIEEQYREYKEAKYPGKTLLDDEEAYSLVSDFIAAEGLDAGLFNWATPGSGFWGDFNFMTEEGKTESVNFEAGLKKYLELLPKELISVHNDNRCPLGENIVGETECFHFDNDSIDSVFCDDYTDPVAAYKEKITEGDGNTIALNAVIKDLNNDGYKDIIYTHYDNSGYMFPHIAINIGGVITEIDYSKEIAIGSLFPSGRNSGFYYDASKGVIVWRYAGHTEGTSFYHAAEAFKICADKIESLWVIHSDEEKYCALVTGDYEEDIEACFNEFEELYKNKVNGYNLQSFYSTCEEW